MWKVIKGFFKCDLSHKFNDDFVWALAEALLWRDEEVSIAAIPAPIRQQPEAMRYYEDALYLIRIVSERWGNEANPTPPAQKEGV